MKKQAGLILIFLVLAHFGTLPAAARVSLRQAGTQSDKASLGIKLSDRAESRVDKGDAPSATDSILRMWLSSQVVNNDRPIANTFYFWTSVPELDSCLRQQRLLRTAVSNNYYEQKYRDELLERSNEENPLISHLMSGERQRIRAAWPNYWTTMHYDHDLIDQQLVQVRLMDSSLIVAFFPDEKKSKRWKVYDLYRQEIPVELAMFRKRHIAAVFISSADKVELPGPGRRVYRKYYRTFILCNETMIKSWHHGVPGVQAQIQKDFDYLMLLNAWFENPKHGLEQGKNGKTCFAAWTKLSSQMKIAELFFASQRDAGNLCEPANTETTKKILDELRYRFQWQLMPCERFPGAQ